jgi:hypothetical protein
MKKIIYSAMIALWTLIIDNCLCQVNQEWVTRYNGPGNLEDASYSAAADANGNVYVTGKSVGATTGYDYCTIKYNQSGVQVWVQRYSELTSVALDEARAIALDNAGNVYVTGRSNGGATATDFCTIKYDSSGSQQWIARYNGPGNSLDVAWTIAVDAGGNVYISGASTGSGTGFDYATIKYNSSGVQQWAARYNGPGNAEESANSVTVDAAGNVYITGRSVGSGTDYDYATIKYNSSGVQQWVARYNGPGNGNDRGREIAVDAAGNVYVTGWSTGDVTLFDYCTIKYDSSGAQQWIRRYDGPAGDDDMTRSLKLDSSGNIYVTGGSTSITGSFDYTTIKYNPAGDSLWVMRYNGPGNNEDIAFVLVLDGSDGVYIAGSSAGTGTGPDFAAVKYDTSGTQQWVARYNGPGNSADTVFAMAVDGSGNVFLTGPSAGGVSIDYATVKLTQLIGITPISNEIPERFQLEQNYPNPFNPATHFQFRVRNFGFVQLKIYDILGNEIETIVSGELKPGTYKADWDGSKYSSGVYFYKLSAGDYTETKKMMLTK